LPLGFLMTAPEGSREGTKKMSTGTFRRSNGHICFAFGGAVEFYEQAGEVFRAPIRNAFDVEGRRAGRWECSREHFDRYREVITSEPVEGWRPGG